MLVDSENHLDGHHLDGHLEFVEQFDRHWWLEQSLTRYITIAFSPLTIGTKVVPVSSEIYMDTFPCYMRIETVKSWSMTIIIKSCVKTASPPNKPHSTPSRPAWP